jgi:hypothetical protein
MQIVDDGKVVDKYLTKLVGKITASSLYRKGFTFGYKLRKGGAKGHGPNRYIMWFGRQPGGKGNVLLEVNVPTQYAGAFKGIRGRFAIDNDREVLLLRAANRMTTPGRVDITSRVEKRFKARKRLLTINGQNWIVLCSVTNFRAQELISSLRLIEECRKVAYSKHHDTMLDDLEELEGDRSVAATEKRELRRSRIGQGKFRNGVLKLWRRRCALTGCDNVDILVASHIKPWAESSNKERLDPHNGLLLLPNLDKLFDKGYITLSADGKVVISNKLTKTQCDALGVYKSMRAQFSHLAGNYMKYHREKWSQLGNFNLP